MASKQGQFHHVEAKGRTCRDKFMRMKGGKCMDGCDKPAKACRAGRRFSSQWSPPPLEEMMDMTSLGLLFELDIRIDELRRMIHVQNQRITQMELEGRDPTSARKALDILERNLRDATIERDQVSRDLERQGHSEIKRKAN
jgi:hypothetical protein